VSIHVDLEYIALVAAIVGFGTAAQFLAAKYRVPSVLFLIVAGITIGPEGLGIITTAIFGDALSMIVGVSVAIIVWYLLTQVDHTDFGASRRAVSPIRTDINR